MTTFERGDIILISYPVNDELEMHLRPVMVVQSVHPSDAGIAVVPISPEPSETYLTLHLPHGSFEAARFGLMSAGYITACEEVVVDRHFVVKRLGCCPWQMLGDFMEMMRQPIIRSALVKTPERAVVSNGLIREAV